MTRSDAAVGSGQAMAIDAARKAITQVARERSGKRRDHGDFGEEMRWRSGRGEADIDAQWICVVHGDAGSDEEPSPG